MSPSEAFPDAGPAELDRRFSALVLDAAILVAVLVGAAAGWWSIMRGQSGLLVSLVSGTALVEVLGYAVLEGRTGSTPGKALTGLRLVSVEDGAPLGVARCLIRSGVIAAAAGPTFGLGLAVLAWTALTDPTGRRRGWHDRISGSMVIERRPMREARPEPGRPAEPVNLSMLRLRAVTRAAPMPAPVPAPAPAPGPGPSLGAEPDPTMAPSRGADAIMRPPAGVRSRDPRPAAWTVTFDTGTVVEVEGLGLVGRQPEGRPGELVRHLIAVPSSDMSVSKTHAQFHLADGALVVMDRGSTNGTTLIRQGVSRRLSAGRPATLLNGDRVRFGDREMTVSRRRLESS